MSYTALYRKWRPDRFEDVKGQDHIVTTLKNQIKSDRIGHAYLFCGTRGTGKTSVAKIFAKAVNCENPIEGSPCGECASCRAIAQGASMNVIEIDAASNNGVDNIRQIRDEVAYSPAEGKYKVYIIDEVHMLSPGAFNALLKTLEEPPSYVIFILATTEAHKIPVTILSRCQRYDFKRITVDTIVERLQELMGPEGIDAEEKAIRYIAKMADGAMRDALSLLDQCVAFYYGQKLTYEQALAVLGAVDTSVFSRMLRWLLSGNVVEAIKELEKAILAGRDIKQFVSDFTWYLRNLLLMKSTEEVEDILDISSENQELLMEEAQMADASVLMRYIRIFSELSDEIKYATQKRVLFEMAIIKVCKPSMETDFESLIDRVRVIEDKLESGDFAVKEKKEESADDEEDGREAPVLTKALSDDIKKIVSNWPAIMARMPGAVAVFLKMAKLSVSDDDKLLIVTANDIGGLFLNKELQRNQISEVLNDSIGKVVDFEIVTLEPGKSFKKNFVDLSKVIKMEIEEE